MNTMALLGILAILYAAICIFIALKKPENIWNIKKIKFFRKSLGEKGTVIFFIIWGVCFGVLGIMLLI